MKQKTHCKQTTSLMQTTSPSPTDYETNILFTQTLSTLVIISNSIYVYTCFPFSNHYRKFSIDSIYFSRRMVRFILYYVFFFSVVMFNFSLHMYCFYLCLSLIRPFILSSTIWKYRCIKFPSLNIYTHTISISVFVFVTIYLYLYLYLIIFYLYLYPYPYRHLYRYPYWYPQRYIHLYLYITGSFFHKWLRNSSIDESQRIIQNIWHWTKHFVDVRF